MKIITKLLAVATALILSIVAMASLAFAHTPAASATCQNGITWHAFLYAEGVTVNAGYDGVTASGYPKVAPASNNSGFPDTNIANPDKTASHTWFVTIDAPGTQYDHSYTGTIPACVTPPTTTTTVPETTTTTTTPPTTTTTVPETTIPPTTLPPTTTTTTQTTVPPTTDPQPSTTTTAPPVTTAPPTTVVVTSVPVTDAPTTTVFTVTDDTTVLPATGSHSNSVVIWAFIILIAGIILVRARRRKTA